MDEGTATKIALVLTRQIDGVCDELEQSIVNNEAPSLQKFLNRVDAVARDRLLLELTLVAIEKLKTYGVKDPVSDLVKANDDIRDELLATFSKYETLVVGVVGRTDLSTLAAQPKLVAIGPNKILKLGHGAVIGDHYRIERPIGSGGMGAVYEAIDTRCGTAVAIKQRTTDDIRAICAIQREAKVLQNLAHPSLPRVIDFFDDERGQFLVMEYISGQTLAHFVDGKNPTPVAVDQAVSWTRQLCQVLSYLHSHDPPTVHRDVKPHNVILRDRNRTVLVDFGLAKGGGHNAPPGLLNSLAGFTVPYAPLEQYDGSGTDPRSDLYSLGASLYHLVTASPPVSALVRATHVLSKQPDPLPNASALNSDVPSTLDAIIARLMSLAAEDRPADAGQVMLALDEFTSTHYHNKREFLNKRIGDYKLIKPIGFGLGTSAWFAHDVKSGRMVAVRVLHKDDEQNIRKCSQEATITSFLDHPNMQVVQKVLVTDETVLVVIDGSIRGESLSKWRKRTYPCEIVTYLKLCMKIAELLHYIHERKVIHPNLIPENILVQGSSGRRPTDRLHEPYLMGFGDASPQPVGTLRYLAPELLLDPPAKADPRSNIYSLGLIVYELLTGELPFNGNALSLIRQAKFAKPRPPQELNRNISDTLARITLKCLEKLPENRYQSARELANDLQRAIDGKRMVGDGPTLGGLGRWLLGVQRRTRLKTHPLSEDTSSRDTQEVIDEARVAPALYEALHRQSLLKGATVLWIDGNPEDTRPLASVLRALGTVVEVVPSLRAAYARLSVITYDVIVLSIDAKGATDAATHFLSEIRAAGLHTNVLFFLGKTDGGRSLPNGAYGAAHDAEGLLQTIVRSLDQQQHGESIIS
ncbi:serine/threonine protein kinase [Lacipirellula limnantheis]|uniref:Serine/threonine-protein kinase PrkC n=1 Tax=Lacipirellula limnantheis TaxID=2528024 RepID=A0A517TRI9_9BACT|nr:serine/threonine-protein kinase [Lacipirellula limnantheis]QDT70991.1 Serine/threonine-protein kinase PrkC [Lacipirellula limnantheis]